MREDEIRNVLETVRHDVIPIALITNRSNEQTIQLSTSLTYVLERLEIALERTQNV